MVLDTRVAFSFLASSGVPQGSRLGPFLFLLYITDIGDVLHVPVLIFADDMRVFVEVASQYDCQTLQRALGSVLDWCLMNEMSANNVKTEMISSAEGYISLQITTFWMNRCGEM